MLCILTCNPAEEAKHEAAAQAGDCDQGMPMLLLGLESRCFWLEGVAIRPIAIFGVEKKFHSLVRSVWTVGIFAFPCSRAWPSNQELLKV